MKVLLLNVVCKYGSTGKIVYDLYNDINKRGDECAVCYGRGEKIKEKNVFKFGINLETYFHALLTRLTGFTGCFSPLSTRRLLKFIKKFKPDVVHIHELHGYYVNIKPVIKYLKKHNVKTILTMHCEFMYTGKCGIARDCEKWQIECNKCPHIESFPSSLLFDHTKKMFNAKKKLFSDFNNLTIVTPSNWLKERVEKSFLKDKTLKVINNGIETSIFNYNSACNSNLKSLHGIGEDEKIILAVAPNLMSENKGGKFVLQLAEQMKEEKVKFILIGVDENITEKNDNVIILGRIYDRKLLANYYSIADAFVICSHRENFPTTCLEAQCSGTKVIGFDVGGVKETIVEDCNLCQYGDIEKLKQLANKVINSGYDKNEFSEISVKIYSNETMCNEYYKLYSSR